MNPWADFLITVIVRFVCGAAIGAFAFFVVRFRYFLKQVASDHFPVEYVLLFALAGGIIAMLTTPRESRPWVR